MFKYSCLVVSLFATDCMANDDAYMQCVQDYLPRAEFDAAALVIKQKCEAIYDDSIMLPREKARLQCQLDSASTAKSEAALKMLMENCDERHDFKNHKG